MTTNRSGAPALPYAAGAVAIWTRDPTDCVGAGALERRFDVSGVPGTGLVAYGTVYPNGQTTLAWCVGDIRSIGVYESQEHVEKIHGHDGATPWSS